MLIEVSCSYCTKEFKRSSNHVNENIKLGHKMFCSDKCHSNSKKQRIHIKCENTSCDKQIERIKSAISPHNYCSARCAALVNNKKFPKHPGKRKICATCHKEFVSREKYCSVPCMTIGQTVSKEEILNQIINFHAQYSRIPLKREFKHAKAARNRYGSWNKAIIAAGFEPNPVMFAKKYISNDGHKCDSLAEKIIDDWLFTRKIKHERRIKYPGNPSLTADFKIGKYWIEFFGLIGEHKRYDELRGEKLKLIKQYNINLIQIYQYHLFPNNQLEELFMPLFPMYIRK